MGVTGTRKMLALALLATVLIIDTAYSAQIPRTYSQQLNSPQEEILLGPQKRPFCNAFTDAIEHASGNALAGRCGRKRSVPSSPGGVPYPELMQRQRIESARVSDEDSLGSLLDLSSEPAVEQLQRQILSEAKLWEAIQEASAELVRRRHAGREPYPQAFSAQ